MDDLSKLGCGIISGIALLVGGPWALFMAFGESRLIGFIALVGWVVIALYIVKYFSLLKRSGKFRGKGRKPW